MINFGDKLRKLMKTRGMKSITLAQKMGVSCAYVSQLMTGIRKPGRETLLKLSKALNVPFETLLMTETDSSGHSYTARRVPVLEKSHIESWANLSDLDYPLSVTSMFEYANTDDPRAFYIITKDFLESCGLDICDLALIEPSKKVDTGDTVFFRSFRGFSVKKIAFKDDLIVLMDEKQEPVFISQDNAKEYVPFYRISHCIKKF